VTNEQQWVRLDPEIYGRDADAFRQDSYKEADEDCDGRGKRFSDYIKHEHLHQLYHDGRYGPYGTIIQHGATDNGFDYNQDMLNTVLSTYCNE
jgi:hypothetical protein